jgi:hypothetical protein
MYDMLGREVQTLVNEPLAAGFHARQWNASGLSSGVYTYRLISGADAIVKKMLLLK